MENNETVIVIAALALALCLLQSKRLDKLERDIRALADGDAEIVKLRRKLDGYPVPAND
jgi:hypothetical protein